MPHMRFRATRRTNSDYRLLKRLLPIPAAFLVRLSQYEFRATILINSSATLPYWQREGALKSQGQ
jgi:hypothetical protein